MNGVVEALRGLYLERRGGLDDWLEGAAVALRPLLDAGSGVLVVRHRTNGDPATWSLDAFASVGTRRDFAKRVAHAFANAPPHFRQRLFGAPGATFSERMGADFAGLPQSARMTESPDMKMVVAREPDGLGISVIAPLVRPQRLTPAARRNVEFLGAHVASSFRLARSRSAPHAVFTPDGRPCDGEVGAAARLRAAVLDQVRVASGRHATSEVLGHWRALIAGRYSLVDRFEADGRRFILAYPNPPGVSDPRGLTEREMSVASYAAFGHPDKLIAYELGIATGTVSALLNRVFRKLALRTRAELAAWLAAPDACARVSIAGTNGVVLSSSSSAGDLLARCTPSERAIVSAITRGLGNREIARLRGTSVRTVAHQVATILRKVGAGSRAALVARVCAPVHDAQRRS